MFKLKTNKQCNNFIGWNIWHLNKLSLIPQGRKWCQRGEWGIVPNTHPKQQLQQWMQCCKYQTISEPHSPASGHSSCTVYVDTLSSLRPGSSMPFSRMTRSLNPHNKANNTMYVNHNVIDTSEGKKKKKNLSVGTNNVLDCPPTPATFRSRFAILISRVWIAASRFHFTAIWFDLIILLNKKNNEYDLELHWPL